MRAICLKQVLCAANYSNTLAQKVAIGSFHSKYKNISKISQRRLTRECNTQTRTSKYKTSADLNTEESEGAEGLPVI